MRPSRARPAGAPPRARAFAAALPIALLRVSLLALLAPSAAPSAPAGAPVVFPSQPLADGTVVAAHASLSGDPSDAAAAKRRAEIVRSPYLQPQERRLLAAGDVEVHFLSLIHI